MHPSLLCWLSLALALLACTRAQDCSFPINYNGTEVWGLTLAPAGAGSPAACAAACCANASCSLYQYCAGGACAPVGSCWVGTVSGAPRPVAGWVSAARAAPLVLDASAPAPPPAPIPGMPPVSRADGSTLSVSSAGFALSGRPFFPVAGEMHFSRVPEGGWAAALRSMRAGGLTTVSTYVIMIHHNEVQGVYDWGGQRNLTAFLLAAREAGLRVALRIGPYAHGEVRGGGLPDWLQAIPGLQLRTSQPAFMAHVQAWYSAVAGQVAGLMWQQGGPVISAQLDNESGDVAYLMACRAAAVAAGLAPPFFVSTGLNKVPFGAMLPRAGMYPVLFWDCGSASNDTSSDYLFARPEFEGSGYPTIWCELGGGMAAVYCMRHRVAPMDIIATAYIAAARSSDLGYYMYHGGENPQGALSTLQERQQFYNGIWDLPVTGYDFVAPLRASGAVHTHYHGLRALHLLTAAFPWLPGAATALPATLPSSATDASTLRWAARSDAATGAALLFFSTYARNLNMTPPQGARLHVTLPGGGVLQVPSPNSAALALPSGSAWAWPLAVPLPGGLLLRYALAQPAGVLEGTAAATVLLLRTPGIAPEVALQAQQEGGQLPEVLFCSGVCSVEGGVLMARGLAVGRGSALTVRSASGLLVDFCVLDSEDGARLWVGRLAGVQRAFLTGSSSSSGSGDSSSELLEFDADAEGAQGVGVLRLRATAGEGAGAAASLLSILPPPSRLALNGSAAPLPPTPDGLFSLFTPPLPSCALTVTVTQQWGGSLPPPAPRGPRGFPTAPGNDGTLQDAAWAAAAVYSVAVTGTPPPGAEVRLRVNWVGDVARLYSSGNASAPAAELLGDVFYNNPVDANGRWEISLSRGRPAGTPVAGLYTLRIVPLRADASGSVGMDSWPDFGSGPGGSARGVEGVEAICAASVELLAVA